MLHMHEVTGSSPVVPTTKKGRLLPSFFCAEAQANLAPAGKERRNRGAGRRVARNAPPRGPPSGVSAEPCCPHHKKRKAFAFFFLCGGAGEPRARGKRTTKPRSRAQGRAERPAEGSPFGGFRRSPVVPTGKTIRIAPFCGRACRSFFPQSPFPFSDDQPPLTTSKGAAFFHIYAQSFGMLANPFASSSSVGI